MGNGPFDSRECRWNRLPRLKDHGLTSFSSCDDVEALPQISIMKQRLCRKAVVSVLILLNFDIAWTFQSSRQPSRSRAAAWRPRASNDATADQDLAEQVRRMRVKEIKEELSKLNISTQDVFEKEQLVQRLVEVRKKNGTRSESLGDSRRSSSSSTTAGNNNNVIIAPLYFTNMDSSTKIAAVNIDGGIQVNPSDQPYATVEFQVFPENGGPSFPLRLLLDTACSGFVLRPSVVESNKLPKFSTPVTMTGAGGTVGATGLTQLSKFSIGGEIFGPLPAAVQDIGALPSGLDGIVGLSFLNKFAAVDMNFAKGQLILYKKGSAALPTVSQKLVARGTIELISHLGIYTVDVMIGGRGPVKMLVDSGAANTFMNWKGVADLGLSKNDNSFLQRIPNPTGAMGSDNIVMRLTHRIGVSSTVNLGNPSKAKELAGLSLADSKRVTIDIGDIPILESMRGQNVGGIMGIDLLMRATCVRLVLDGPTKEILLYQ